MRCPGYHVGIKKKFGKIFTTWHTVKQGRPQLAYIIPEADLDYLTIHKFQKPSMS